VDGTIRSLPGGQTTGEFSILDGFKEGRAGQMCLGRYELFCAWRSGDAAACSKSVEGGFWRTVSGAICSLPGEQPTAEFSFLDEF